MVCRNASGGVGSDRGEEAKPQNSGAGTQVPTGCVQFPLWLLCTVLSPLPNKKSRTTEKVAFGSPAIFRSEDPLLSAPFSRRVWLYRGDPLPATAHS